MAPAVGAVPGHLGPPLHQPGVQLEGPRHGGVGFPGVLGGPAAGGAGQPALVLLHPAGGQLRVPGRGPGAAGRRVAGTPPEAVRPVPGLLGGGHLHGLLLRRGEDAVAAGGRDGAHGPPSGPHSGPAGGVGALVAPTGGAGGAGPHGGGHAPGHAHGGRGQCGTAGAVLRLRRVLGEPAGCPGAVRRPGGPGPRPGHQAGGGRGRPRKRGASPGDDGLGVGPGQLQLRWLRAA